MFSIYHPIQHIYFYSLDLVYLSHICSIFVLLIPEYGFHYVKYMEFFVSSLLNAIYPLLIGNNVKSTKGEK